MVNCFMCGKLLGTRSIYKGGHEACWNMFCIKCGRNEKTTHSLYCDDCNEATRGLKNFKHKSNYDNKNIF